MRLYSRTGATALDDPEFGHFDAVDNGAFDLPDDLAERLHGFHVNKQPLWETDIERQRRLMDEELERRRDPAALLSAVEQILKAGQVAQAAASESAPPVKAAKATRSRKAATSE